MSAKIAIIDDDPNIRELLYVNLQRRGYDAVSEGDSTKALDVIHSHMPDLVVLDVMMPEIDGWEICKIIRDDEKISHIKILMLTAKSTAKDKMIGKDILKADEYVTKPFDMGQLIHTVKRLLDEIG
ncbi:MAG: response regulator transcription factor [Chitinivibrionales bacterium]